MRKVLFVAKEGPLQQPHARSSFVTQTRDGEYGWTVLVDGQEVCEVNNDEMDVADTSLDPLWEALGLEVKFDFD